LAGFTLSLSSSVPCRTGASWWEKPVATQHPVETMWIILQTSPFFNCTASYLFRMAFSLTEMCFNVGFFRDTWHDNRIVFFGVLSDCFLWKCKCSTFFTASKPTTTNKSRSRIFSPTLEIQLDHFLHHTSMLGILVKMVQFILKLCWNRFFAVHHSIYWLLIAAKLLTVKLHSLHVRQSKFWKGWSWKWVPEILESLELDILPPTLQPCSVVFNTWIVVVVVLLNMNLFNQL